jgi:multidrug efflux pump subunit AcrA (membrane-fusion protein)
LALVKPGQTAQLVDLDAPAQPIGASVRSVGSVADPKTGLFTVVVDVPDRPPQPVTVGAHLRATIATTPVAGWIVPRDSVLTDENGAFAFQISDGKAVRVPVTILAGAGDRLAVSGALDPKKKLVVAGSYQLSDGMPVREQSDKTPAAPASK